MASQQPPPSQPSVPTSAHAAARRQGQASTSGSYDYVTALQNVQNRIQQLTAERDQYKQAPSVLRNAVRYWRANWGNVLLLLSLYSMSTATVLSVFFSERQKQAEQLLYQEQMQGFELHSQRLRQQMEGSRAVLQRVEQELRDSRRAPWLRSSGVQKLQASIAEERTKHTLSGANLNGDMQAAEQEQQHQPPGMRVGPQRGRGFVI